MNSRKLARMIGRTTFGLHQVRAIRMAIAMGLVEWFRLLAMLPR
jgi:hypothetical protein